MCVCARERESESVCVCVCACVCMMTPKKIIPDNHSIPRTRLQTHPPEHCWERGDGIRKRETDRERGRGVRTCV